MQDKLPLSISPSSAIQMTRPIVSTSHDHFPPLSGGPSFADWMGTNRGVRTQIIRVRHWIKIWFPEFGSTVCRSEEFFSLRTSHISNFMIACVRKTHATDLISFHGRICNVLVRKELVHKWEINSQNWNLTKWNYVNQTIFVLVGSMPKENDKWDN